MLEPGDDALAARSAPDRGGSRPGMRPGLHYDLAASEYHADPAERPSLSCSVAQLLLDATPQRAWAAHPRLAGARVREATREMDEGTVLHTLLTGTGAEPVAIAFDSYKTKAAQEARDAARDAGGIPILSERLAELNDVAATARRVIAANSDIAQALSPEARSEVTMIWQDEGQALCRARPDRMLPQPQAPIFDFKFTTKVDPLHKWDRRMVEDGYDVRAAFYSRGAHELRGVAPPYVFIVVETTPPYDVLPLQCTPEMLALGEDKVEHALMLWIDCTRKRQWPGHPRRILHVSPPNWAAARWEERKSLAQFERPEPRRSYPSRLTEAEIDVGEMLA